MHSLKSQKVKALYSHQKNKAELKKLIKDKNIYLSDIDVSKMKNFKDLFKNSRHRDFGGIEKWDTSKVTTMESYFEEAEFFNHDIESWNVINVKNMKGMFYGAKNFNQPLDKWDVSKVKNFKDMFYECKNFNQNLDSWKLGLKMP